MLYKICSRCGRRLAPGERCNCLGSKLNARRRAAEYDTRKRDKKAAAFYHSRGWRKARLAVMARSNGLDELQRYRGTIMPAVLIHHITPVKEGPSAACDLGNLIALSSASHKLVHDLYNNPERKAETQALLRAIVRKEMESMG